MKSTWTDRQGFRVTVRSVAVSVDGMSPGAYVPNAYGKVALGVV
jgi:hypothetical protein